MATGDKPDFEPGEPYDPNNARNPAQAGCGALLGLALPLGGGFLGFSVWRMSALTAVITFAGSAAICGLLAWQFGDRFWGGLRRWWL